MYQPVGWAKARRGPSKSRTAVARLCPRGLKQRLDRVGKIALRSCDTRTYRKAILPTLRGAIISAIIIAPASAQDFFAGTTISLSTHSTTGAGYDTYLRLLARHMGNHIPGHPGFVVLNQPGAGGLLAANYAAKVAPQDGTFLTLVSQGLLVIEAVGG